jgi:hypothetical protein
VFTITGHKSQLQQLRRGCDLRSITQFTRRKRRKINAINKFLWEEERKLAAAVLKGNEMGLVWSEDEEGRFSEEKSQEKTVLGSDASWHKRVPKRLDLLKKLERLDIASAQLLHLGV